MAGVYVAYPFCAQKCTFCNFASGAFPRAIEARYRETLGAEIARHTWEWTPETVYIGGGTPSGMDPEALAAILERIPGRPWREATIEIAPGTVTPERARQWVRAGLGRGSLGVQSFVRAELAGTGRRHTAEIVAADIRTLREAGFTTINIDLIAGLPRQTAESWRESLEWIERLSPEHVSVYMLEVDEDSRLGREILGGGTRYGAGAAPSEELTAELYETAVARLRAMGIPRYEISNFARPGCESRHNLKYWLLHPYAGFGAGAHSFDGRVRRENSEEIADYLAGRGSTEIEARIEEERWFVGLRLSAGVNDASAGAQRWREPIERFVREGLLERDNGVLRLTDRGVLFSNEVFQEFIG